MNPYVLLIIAIVFEVIGTSLLKLADGFTNLLPTIGALACYGGAFYCMSVILRTVPIGFTYAIWSGLGIVFITLIGLVAFHQKLDFAGYLGIGLIVSGVLVLNLFSSAAPH